MMRGVIRGQWSVIRAALPPAGIGDSEHWPLATDHRVGGGK
jgi:hypothetical protein